MLIRLNNCLVDPIEIASLSVQSNHDESCYTIVLYLRDGSGMIAVQHLEDVTPDKLVEFHEEFEKFSEMIIASLEIATTEIQEAEDRRNSSSHYFNESSSGPGGDSVEMVRLPVAELESKCEAAYEAGMQSRRASAVLLSMEALRAGTQEHIGEIFKSLEIVEVEEDDRKKAQEVAASSHREMIESVLRGAGIAVSWAE